MRAVVAGTLLARIFKLDRSEVPKLLVFGLFGLLLEIGLGVGVSAGDAAFLTNVGAESLPLVFLLTPVVMIAYTIIFSILTARFSIDRVVDVTLGLLVAGGIGFWLLLRSDSGSGEAVIYLGLKLYLAMWQIALYSLFWNIADAYFDIQDAKRLFPLFAAGAAAGTAIGASIVGLLAPVLPLAGFFLIWAAVAALTAPVAILLRRRWTRLLDVESHGADASGPKGMQLVSTVRKSPYTLLLSLTLFATLLITNLGEYQYSAVLSAGRSEAELAALLGQLYAGANIFTMFVSLALFNRLVSRLGVRNVALIGPVIYFLVFSYFFVNVGAGAAIILFMANHAIQVAIDNNNQNLLFNALPSAMKARLRTIIEGIGEPLATCLMGGFLLFLAPRLNLRELAGVGILLGLVLLVAVLLLRSRYPRAMAANMQHGWLDFSKAAPAMEPRETLAPNENDARAEMERLATALGDASPLVRKDAVKRLQALARPDDDWIIPDLLRSLPTLDRDEQVAVIGLLGMIGDIDALPAILSASDLLGPRERRAMGVMLAGLGGAAVPALALTLRAGTQPYRVRRVAARALAGLSFAQFSALLPGIVDAELGVAHRALESARIAGSAAQRSRAANILAIFYREQVAASVDYLLDILALGRLLPDHDLMVTNLQSANRKARANALEAIEAGVGHALFKQMEPLLKSRPDAPHRASAKVGDADLRQRLAGALRSDIPLEAAAAAEALGDILPQDGLAAALRQGIRPGMPALLSDTILKLLGLAPAGQSLVDKVADLRATPAFRYATTEALAALALTGRRPEDIDRVSGRFVDLALSRLKAQDELDDAA